MSDSKIADINIEINEFGGVYASVPAGIDKKLYSAEYLDSLLKSRLFRHPTGRGGT